MKNRTSILLILILFFSEILFFLRRQFCFFPMAQTYGAPFAFFEKNETVIQKKIFVVLEKIKMVNKKIKYSSDIKIAFTQFKNTISHTEINGKQALCILRCIVEEEVPLFQSVCIIIHSSLPDYPYVQ